MKALYNYQQELVDKAGKSTALFWDMGLGKTITSLEVFKKHDLDLLFVVAPLSMLGEWQKEFESQVRGKAINYKQAIKDSKKENISDYIKENNIKCIVLNYEMVWRIKDYSWLNDKSMIILDESHRIKNPNSKVGRFMKHLAVKTDYKMILTGTPQSQGYMDYYNQLLFIDFIDMSFTAFKNRYCVYEDKMFYGVKIKQLSGYKNVGEFEKEYLNKCEFLKVDRVYDEVVKENYIKLPTTRDYESVKRNRVIYYDKDENIITNRKEINSYLAGEKSSIIDSYDLLDNIGAYRFGLRSLLDNKHKKEWLKDFIEDYEKRIVIFYNYNVELDSIKKIIGERPYSIYNGEFKDLEIFKNNENGIAIVNYKSGSFGINDLIYSNIFIAYSPTDNYLEWEQSKKRIDRNGQKNTPIYYFLESGIESRIYYSLQSGKNFDDRVFLEEITLDKKQ